MFFIFIFNLVRNFLALIIYFQCNNLVNRPLLSLHGHVQFDLPPTKFVSTYQTIDLSLVGSPLTLKYLKQYAHMFDEPKERPLST